MLEVVAAAVALLKPYVTKAAFKAAETVGEASVKGLGHLYSLVSAKMTAAPTSTEAWNDFLAAPDSADRQGALRVQLEKIVERDAEFAKALASVVQENRSETTFVSKQEGDHNKSIQVSGNNINIRQ
jgi:hypothetical protein